MKILTKTERLKRLAYKHKVKKLKEYAKREWEKLGGKDIDGNEISLEAFTNRSKAKMDAEGISPKKAVKKIVNTEEFTDPGTRSRANLTTSLRKEYGINLRKIKNPKTDKFYRSWEDVFDHMVWDKNLNAYVFNNKWAIVTSNSPKTTYLEDIKTGEKIFTTKEVNK